MHRRYISPWGYYEGWDFAPLNRKNNVDYLTSSCINWLITEEHLYALDKLDTCNHVKAIYLKLEGPSDPIVLNALAQKLSTNTSINRLTISDKSAGQLYNLLVNPVPVRFEVVDSLINVLRVLTTRNVPMIQLDIELPFHASLHRSLVELLAAQPSLKHLSLEMINMPRETFDAIIRALSQYNKSLKTLKFANITDVDNQIIDVAVAMVKNFNLTSLYMVPAVNHVEENDSRFIELKQLGLRITTFDSVVGTTVIILREKEHRPLQTPVFPVITNDALQTNVIQTLPDDVLQYILNGLDIKSLLSLKRTNNQFQSWMQSSSFWHNYYLSKANTIPTDILTAADLIYGSCLDQNRRVNFWQCICMAFTGSLLRRDVSTEYHSLNAFHEELLKKLLQAYPELRMMESVIRRVSLYSKWRRSKNWYPIRLSFYTLGSSHVVYHLNIDMTRPDAVGVRFFHGEISRAEEDWNPTPRAIYDMFVSSSISEVITRVKPMVESMTVALRSATAYVYRNLIIIRIIDCQALPEIHKKSMKSIENTFDTYSKALMDELQVKFDHYEAFKKVIKQFSDHVSSVKFDHVTPNYSAIHHQVNQTAYNQLYQVNNDNGAAGYWNFQYSFLDMHFKQRKVKQPVYNVAAKKERVKKTPYIALICLFRKVLNLVMMPVLKSLWLRDLNDPHVAWYSFDKLESQYDHQTTSLAAWYDYYCDKWQPLSSISVSHTKPSVWPMSAIVVGSRLAPSICEVVVAVMKDKLNGLDGAHSEETKTKIDALARAIEEYDLFPKSHIHVVKSALQ